MSRLREGAKRPRQNVLLGCGMMLLATVFFAAMHACVRVLSDDGLHPYEIAFFRCFFGLLMLAPWLVVHARTALHTRHFGMHVTRAALNVVAMFMFFTALGITPIAQVQALSFTAPLFTTVLAVFFLGETVRLRRWSAVAIGFLGVLIIVQPGSDAFNVYAFSALLAVVFVTARDLLTSRANTNTPSI